MRALLPLIAIAVLAACTRDEPENVQARAANASLELEQHYNEIQAEAENDTQATAAPVEAEADALLNQLNAAAPADTNSAGNAH